MIGSVGVNAITLRKLKEACAAKERDVGVADIEYGINTPQI
jgi:hypothetical protein